MIKFWVYGEVDKLNNDYFSYFVSSFLLLYQAIALTSYMSRAAEKLRKQNPALAR